MFEVVHTHTRAWLEDLLSATQQHDFVVSKEGEGPVDLVYRDPNGGAMRLNDAMYVNTGVLVARRAADGWTSSLLASWWRKGSEIPDYRFGRAYDQGALGHVIFTHGIPSSKSGSKERESNAAKAAWRKRIAVLDPKVMNNHAPGGSFSNPKAYGDISK